MKKPEPITSTRLPAIRAACRSTVAAIDVAIAEDMVVHLRIKQALDALPWLAPILATALR